MHCVSNDRCLQCGTEGHEYDRLYVCEPHRKRRQELPRVFSKHKQQTSLATKGLVWERGLVVRKSQATSWNTLNTCKNNGRLRAPMTKEEVAHKNGFAQRQVLGLSKSAKTYTAIGNDIVQLCFDHEREPKYGEYGMVPAKCECQKHRDK